VVAQEVFPELGWGFELLPELWMLLQLGPGGISGLFLLEQIIDKGEGQPSSAKQYALLHHTVITRHDAVSSEHIDKTGSASARPETVNRRIAHFCGVKECVATCSQQTLHCPLNCCRHHPTRDHQWRWLNSIGILFRTSLYAF
jgi:hypothetical protein